MSKASIAVSELVRELPKEKLEAVIEIIFETHPTPEPWIQPD